MCTYSSFYFLSSPDLPDPPKLNSDSEYRSDVHDASYEMNPKMVKIIASLTSILGTLIMVLAGEVVCKKCPPRGEVKAMVREIVG